MPDWFIKHLIWFACYLGVDLKKLIWIFLTASKRLSIFPFQ